MWFTESSGKESQIPINIYVNQVQSVQTFSNIQDIKLYPNPFNQDLMLECKLFEPEDITLSIYNIYGSLLFRKKVFIDNKLFLLNINEYFKIQDLPNAIYLIQISTNKNQNTLKVIKD